MFSFKSGVNWLITSNFCWLIVSSIFLAHLAEVLGEVVILFFPSFHSFSLPEKFEYIVTKYAEHSHDKWACDKVGIIIQPTVVTRGKNNQPKNIKVFSPGNLPDASK